LTTRLSMDTLSPASKVEATKRIAAFAVNGPVPTDVRSMLRLATLVVLVIWST
jgi:hypothetical protein